MEEVWEGNREREASGANVGAKQGKESFWSLKIRPEDSYVKGVL